MRGILLAISQFYAQDDSRDRVALEEAAMATLLYRCSILTSYDADDWQVELANIRHSSSQPTPPGVIFTDARADAFPVSETTLGQCILIAK